jgi:hypothetical protein
MAGTVAHRDQIRLKGILVLSCGINPPTRWANNGSYLESGLLGGSAALVTTAVSAGLGDSAGFSPGGEVQGGNATAPER